MKSTGMSWFCPIKLPDRVLTYKVGKPNILVSREATLIDKHRITDLHIGYAFGFSISVMRSDNKISTRTRVRNGGPIIQRDSLYFVGSAIRSCTEYNTWTATEVNGLERNVTARLESLGKEPKPKPLFL